MTAPLDLDAIRSRAVRVDEYAKKDPCGRDGFRPLSVREHFDRDVPALIAEVERLRAAMGDSAGRLDYWADQCEAFSEAQTMRTLAGRLRLAVNP